MRVRPTLTFHYVFMCVACSPWHVWLRDRPCFVIDSSQNKVSTQPCNFQARLVNLEVNLKKASSGKLYGGVFHDCCHFHMREASDSQMLVGSIASTSGDSVFRGIGALELRLIFGSSAPEVLYIQRTPAAAGCAHGGAWTAWVTRRHCATTACHWDSAASACLLAYGARMGCIPVIEVLNLSST